MSDGSLEFLSMVLMDMSTIRTGVEAFLTQQTRLDVLVNNAGVSCESEEPMAISQGCSTNASHLMPKVMLKGSNEPRQNEIHIMTNCVGPCLLYKLLLPILTKTATSAPTGSVRTLWAGSIAVEVNSPKPAGMVVDENGQPRDLDELSSYGQSKVGNVFLASLYGKETAQTRVVHGCFNPGNLRTELQRHWHGIDLLIMVNHSFVCLRFS